MGDTTKSCGGGFEGGKVQYSEVESPTTSMSKVGKVADVPMDNPSGTGVPSNKDYYPKSGS